MSNIILHIRNDEGRVERIFLAVEQLARWCAPPKQFVASGQLPSWAGCLITLPDGMALPVIEDPDVVAALHSKARQVMFWGWNYDPDTQQIWMFHYERGAVDAQSAAWPEEGPSVSRPPKERVG